MPPELELVRQWLEKVRLDLRSAELAMAVDPPLVEDVCFHSQQAVEKALKAFLIHRDVEFEWTHRIRYLLNLCAEDDVSFEQWRTEAEPLTEYAVQFRYPHPEPAPAASEGQAALNVAQRVYTFILKKLPVEVHPSR